MRCVRAVCEAKGKYGSGRPWLFKMMKNFNKRVTFPFIPQYFFANAAPDAMQNCPQNKTDSKIKRDYKNRVRCFFNDRKRFLHFDHVIRQFVQTGSMPVYWEVA